jgi:type I restriction enzyme S subunit
VRGAGTKMVNMGELFANSRIANIPMDRVPLTQSEAERSLLKAGDLLFARQSLVLEGAGKCSIFLGDQEPVTFESHVTRVRLNPEEADPRFYFYWLQSFSGRNAIRSIVEQGAGAAGIRGSDLQNLSVIWCPVEVQRQIADILSVLDDKIELNRRMNETLEAMARAIFQSWFVDFDPVRAKASGESADSICQRLGLTPELLALFPDSFEDSELGEIPKGWTHSTLAAEAKRCGGFIQTGPFGSQLHASDYVDEGVPVVMPQDLNNRRISVERIVRVTEEMAQRLTRHSVRPGDVVYSRRGDVERHALVSDREAGWLCGTGCLLVRLGAAWPSQAYLSEVLDLPVTREWLVRHAVGATMPNLNTSILGAVPLLMPSEPLLHAFEAVAGPFRKQQVASSVESDSLAHTRDALLPKLLNGEIGLEDFGLAVA